MIMLIGVIAMVIMVVMIMFIGVIAMVVMVVMTMIIVIVMSMLNMDSAVEMFCFTPN